MVGPPGRLFWLDWIRFLAASVVVLDHCRGTNWVEWSLLDKSSQSVKVFVAFSLTRLGYEAVIIFFVLSGFLVGGRTIERLSRGTFDFPSYAIDRITRIYVPLLPALVLTGVAAVICSRDLQLGRLAASIPGLQGIVAESPDLNPTLWSLAYEIWFYVLGGAAAFYVMRSSTARLAAFAMLVLCLGLFTWFDATFLFCWMIGGLAYGISFKYSKLCTLLGVVIAMAATTASQLSTAGYGATILHVGVLPRRQVSLIALALGSALILGSICRRSPRTATGALLERIGTPLAALSYTLYLVHSPLLFIWQKYRPEKYNTVDLVSVVSFLAAVTMCFVGALVMYLLFERHTVRVRRLLIGRYTGEADHAVQSAA